MLRILAICFAAAIVSLSAACSSSNVSADLTPERDASVTPIGGGTGGDDAMKLGSVTPIGGGTGGDDAMKCASVTPIGGGTGGDDAMGTPPPPPPPPPPTGTP